MSAVAQFSPEQAADFADRVLAAIDADPGPHGVEHHNAADRERVASDLVGLLDCHGALGIVSGGLRHAIRYSKGLLRTGSLYGVTP